MMTHTETVLVKQAQGSPVFQSLCSSRLSCHPFCRVVLPQLPVG